MAVSRAYATGKRQTFTLSCTLTLYRCGGRFIRTPEADWEGAQTPPYEAGWLGSDFFYVYSLFDDTGGPIYDGGSHSIQLNGFGNGFLYVKAITGFVDRDPPNADYAWRTEIELCGEVIQRWDEIDEPGTFAGTPETLVVPFSASFSAEEWVYEKDNAGNADRRPQSAHDPTLAYAWKPTTAVTVTAYGAARVYTAEQVFGRDASLAWSGEPSGPVVARTAGHFDLSVAATQQRGFGPGSFTMQTIPEANGLGAWRAGSPDSGFSNLSFMGTLPKWTSSGMSVRASAGTPCAFAEVLGSGVLYWVDPTFSHLTGHEFVFPVTLNVPMVLSGSHRYDVTVNGAIRDWNGPLTGIPVRFSVTQYPCLTTGPTDYPFTGSHTLDGLPAPTILPPAGYSSNDSDAALFRVGEEWSALTLDRAESLPVEDFSRIGGANGWGGTDCSFGPSYAAGKLSVTGAGSGTPRIDKTLKSDFSDMRLYGGAPSGPAGWWQANGGNLTALSAAEQTEANAWWDGAGDPASSPHLGEWWKVGRKLLADSDVFNWSAFRYLELTGSADADCDVTVRITWEEYVFTQKGSNPYDVDVALTTKNASYTVSLTTVSAAHRIDLPSKAGVQALRYVTALRITFPTGRTLHLEGMTLVEEKRPTIDVHHPHNDFAFLGALADGKPALFLTPRSSAIPSSAWGWPVMRWLTGGYYGSLTTGELVRELNLQEGWTATGGGEPDHETPSYAVWMKEAFEQPCPAALPGRRSFGQVTLYPKFEQTLDMEANLGSAVHVLAFDPVTFEPARVPVEAWDASPAKRSAAQADGTGYARLELTKEEPFDIYANKGLPTESVANLTAISRTWGAVRLTGTEAAGNGGGAVALDVDRLGNQWIAYAPTAGERAGKVLVGRKLGVASAWETFVVAPGASPWIHVDETHAESLIRVVFTDPEGNVAQLESKSNGSEWTALKTIAAGANGGFLRKDKATGITYYLYWRNVSGGTVYLKRSDDDGTTFKEAEIAVVSGVAEQTATLDFLLDGERTIEVVYTDGTDILSKTSADNGITWA